MTVRFGKKRRKRLCLASEASHFSSSPTNHAWLLAVNYGDVCESSPVYDARNRLAIMSVSEFKGLSSKVDQSICHG